MANPGGNPSSGSSRPPLPTIVTSFGQPEAHDGRPAGDAGGLADPFRTPAGSSNGGSQPPSPTHHRSHSHGAGGVPSLAVSDSSGRLAVPWTPDASTSKDGGQSPASSDHGGPPSPSLSATSSENSRSPFVGRSTSQHPLFSTNDSPRRFAGTAAGGGGRGKHTRQSPSVATMGSVFTEEGDVTAPIAVDFDDGDEEHIHSDSGLGRKGSTGSGGWSTAGLSGRDRQGSVGATSSLGVPETVGEDSEQEDGAVATATAAGPSALPEPATSKPAKKRTLWQRITRRGKESEEEDPKPDPDDEEADPMMAARLAARQAAALPDPPASEMAPFTFSPRKLNSLVDPKSLETLTELGGPEGLLKGLQVERKQGLQEGGENWEKRGEVYGENRIPQRKSKSLFLLMWIAIQDKVLILLLIAAAVSLALGLYTTFGTPPEYYQDEDGNEVEEPKVDWVEGCAILVAVAIVTLVGSLNDWQKERQFRKLNAQKEERNVKIVRSGHESLLNVHEVRVGDIVLLEPGEIIPVDGVLLEGHQLRCDESSATGESDAVRKSTWEEIEANGHKGDPFLISGSKVLEGYGKYLVIGVGKYSFYGKIMMSLRGDSEGTPLQLKLNRLAELIAKLGSLAGGLLFFVLMIKFFVQLGTNPNRSANDKAQNFIQVLIIAVTVIVVAVPEGLPLAVTLALAFATRRMTKMNLLVRVLSSCETMANATVVCTDKTGTLTTNQMTVVAGSVGVHLKFADRIAENEARVNANDDIEGIDEGDAKERDPSVISEKVEPRQGRLDFSMDMVDVSKTLEEPLRKLMNESIAINTTAFEGTDERGVVGFVGSKTETALLAFAKNQGWDSYKPIREGAKVVQMVPFSSERKAMGVVIERPEGGYRLLLKGASEVLCRRTTRYVYVRNPAGDARPLDQSVLSDEAVPTAPFDHETRGNINRTIIFYANQSLRTIALCYRDFPSWPPPKMDLNEAGEVEYTSMAENLTLLSVVGIEDPLRPGVTEAVATCAGAGVAVKMVTGDNIITAKSIATQCGIYSPGGIIMEGPVFRKLKERDLLEVAPRLQVLARSSPEDKKLLVDTLKHLGEVVGVTGDGTNDSPALKTANVGFSMGIAGTEVAKEASDIILMDDNFASIVSAIMWGRCVNDSVKKFLQFQISVNITAVIVTFVTAIASNSESSVLTAVQLLWVNLIMDTFAALALATDPASPDSLKRKPDSKTADLISVDMWKMIVGQSIFQLIAVLVLNFAGKQILNQGHSTNQAILVQEDHELKTLVFNTFVFCQIFNQLNARVLDRKLNIFSRFWKNYYFLTIMAIMIGGQILIIFVGGAAFQVVEITGRDWGISIVVGALSLPIGVLIRLIPTEPIAEKLYKWKLCQDPNALPKQSSEADDREYNPAIEKVRDNLATFGQIRGGRLRASSFVGRSRTDMLRKKDIHPGALMTMVPTLVMSSIGAGWSPVDGSLSDPAASDPSPSASHLWKSRYEVHPDTQPTDPMVQRIADGSFIVPGRSRSVSAATGSSGGASPLSPFSPGTLGSPQSPRMGGNTLSVPSSPIR